MTSTHSHGFFYRQVKQLLMRWFIRQGWRVESCGPLPDKLVMIAAPHTSNWDLPFALGIAFHLDIAIRWVGKKSIFRWPFGGLMRWLGGVSVDRSKRSDTVQQLANSIRTSQARIHLVIAPEGTRDAVAQWKSGFYHIALAANVPLALAFVDYKRKVGGVVKIMQPSGDYDADLKIIQDIYSKMTPKHPEKSSLYRV
jgi:1-acyl-sn-glycerol-3-phosphate acyltransferase